jgi:hypothetical protein
MGDMLHVCLLESFEKGMLLAANEREKVSTGWGAWRIGCSLQG